MTRESAVGERLRRHLSRWGAWQSEQLDSLTSSVTRRLDGFNRALARRAVPRSRQERVEALVSERQHQGPALEVIRGGESRNPEDC